MKNYKFKGFTLIEVLVATGIFSILVLIIAGLFARFSASQRRDIAEQALAEDIRFAIELVSREARTGYGSTYALDETGKVFSFRNQNRICVAYRVQAGALERAEYASGGINCPPPSGRWGKTTSPSTNITTLRWDVAAARAGSDNLPDNQGYVTMKIRAASHKQTSTQIGLQTTTTSRQVSLYTAN